MSDPGTTYRTREEIQNMRSSNDAIQGMKSKLLEWGVVTEAQLKVLLSCNTETNLKGNRQGCKEEGGGRSRRG